MNKQISTTIYNYISEFKNKSSFMLTESHQQILLDYEDLITSLSITSSISPILCQVIKFLNSLSQASTSYEYCCS